MKELGDYYMDVKLTGGHWQCDWDDGTCEEMNKEIEWAEHDTAERGNDFKYVFDVSQSSSRPSSKTRERKRRFGQVWAAGEESEMD